LSYAIILLKKRLLVLLSLNNSPLSPCCPPCFNPIAAGTERGGVKDRHKWNPHYNKGGAIIAPLSIELGIPVRIYNESFKYQL
jgi:hypothetical protein